MTARAWTLAQLNEVHPLPAGRAWFIDPDRGPIVTGESVHVWCDAEGRLRTDELCDGEDGDVCIAVILASRGCDSLGTMAANVADRIQSLNPAGRATTEAVAWARFGREALGEVEVMLRRGTVTP